jgi:hypothetical protein
MRGRSTWLLLAALIGLGLVAAVDALRGGDREPKRGRGVATTSPAADLRRADVTGVLYFSVRSEGGCRLRALALPGLQDAASFDLEWCRFDVSPNGNVVAGPPCPGRTFEIRSVDALSSGFQGCAPAWKPTGELTFVRDGDVLTPDGEILFDNLVVLARRAFPGERTALVRYVREMAWLSDTRLVAVLRNPTGEVADVVVIFESGRVLPADFRPAGSSVYVSREAQQIFVAYPTAGVGVYDRRGAFLSQSRFTLPDIGAVAVSPDGRWVALARPGNVCIYEEIDPPPRERFPVACLPFDAVDLAWL